MQLSAGKYKRIVVKIGSSLFYSGKELDVMRLFDIASNISNLVNLEGKEVVIVSSGAIALGMDAKKIKVRPKELSYLQAVAAIGQNLLMDNYSNYFKKFKITCAQVLLTRDDFDNRKRYLNAKNTLETLLRLKTVPVINENDTISTEEIKFGDNDCLSALVATLINADLLIILSDVEGLLDVDKKLIKVVTEVTPRIKALACPSNRKTSVGGMITKVEAAKIAMDSGIPCVITKGGKGRAIFEIVHNPESGGEWTIFLPKKGNLSAKERWIAFSTKTKGAILVDEGARIALINKKSLLSVGIVSLEGNFNSGDIVSIRDKRNCEFARGKVGIAAGELDRVKGTRFEKEIVHRDNIVLL